MNGRGRTIIFGGAALAFIGLAALAGLATATADENSDLNWSVKVGGKEISADTGGRVPLYPGRHVPTVITIDNGSPNAVVVDAIRFEGKVLGFTFYVNSANFNAAVASGENAKLQFPMDLSNLSGQATGLIPSEVSLLGPQGRVLSTHDFTANVDGSMKSTYGIFGIAVGIATLYLLVRALLALRFGWLPQNRWLRALPFAIAGLGVGFTLTFTMSALSVATPSPGAWATFLLVGGLIGLAVGYFVPRPPDTKAQIPANPPSAPAPEVLV